MQTQTVELPASLIRHAKKLTGQRDASAAIIAAIHEPNPETKAFRAKHARGSTVVRGSKQAADFMRKFLG